MIKEKLQSVINKQINAEFYSANIYLSMAAYFLSKNLKGSAHWLELQAKEETGHAMRLYGYLNEKGGRIILESIEKPKVEWESALEVFKHALQHEIKITGMIYEIMNLATAERDYATANMLQWFVAEQVEEEAQTQEIVIKLESIANNPVALMYLDSELGKRKE